MAKMTNLKVKEIRRLAATGLNSKEISNLTGIPWSTVKTYRTDRNIEIQRAREKAHYQGRKK